MLCSLQQKFRFHWTLLEISVTDQPCVCLVSLAIVDITLYYYLQSPASATAAHTQGEPRGALARGGGKFEKKLKNLGEG